MMNEEADASSHSSLSIPRSSLSLNLPGGALGLFDEALEARDLLLGRLARLRVKFGRDLEARVRALLGLGLRLRGGRRRRFGRGGGGGPFVSGRAGREFRGGF